jgi:hypothetical protein
MEELIPSEVSDLISKKPELTYILLRTLLTAYFQSIDSEATQDKIDNLIWNFLNTYDTTEKKIMMEDIN